MNVSVVIGFDKSSANAQEIKRLQRGDGLEGLTAPRNRTFTRRWRPKCWAPGGTIWSLGHDEQRETSLKEILWRRPVIRPAPTLWQVLVLQAD